MSNSYLNKMRATIKGEINNLVFINFVYQISEPCPGLVDCVVIWTKEPFIKNKKSAIDMFYFLSKQNIIVLLILDINDISTITAI